MPDFNPYDIQLNYNAYEEQPYTKALRCEIDDTPEAGTLLVSVPYSDQRWWQRWTLGVLRRLRDATRRLYTWFENRFVSRRVEYSGLSGTSITLKKGDVVTGTMTDESGIVIERGSDV